MPNPYDSVTISGYNNSPPPDDGSETEANRVKWATIKTKLPDPLKTAIETINTNITDAFDAIAFNGINTQSSPYTVQESDQGKIIRTDSDVTLLATGTAQAGFFLVIQNVGTADLTIDADGTEKILVTTNGDAVSEDETFTLSPQQTLFLVADGVNGWVVVQSAPQVIFGTDEASDDDYIVTSANYRISTLQEGPLFVFYPQTNNEGAATVNWDDTGAKDLKKGDNESVETGDVLANRPVLMTYDATEDTYHVFNPQTGDIVLDEFVGGLNLTINATDSNHDVDAAKGTATVSNASGDKDYATTTATVTKKIDADWAEGNNQGGMGIKTMTGTFTTSGTSVTGSGTDFDNEFEVGDVLFSDTESVARKVTTVASGTSMTLDSAFPADVSGGGDDVKKGGLAPDTTYNYFIIKDAENQDVDFGFDTTDDAEVILSSDASDYEFSKKIGEVDTDSDSNIELVRNFSSDRVVEEIQDQATGGLLGVEVFTSSGTWNAPTKTSAIEVIVVGAGGGGGPQNVGSGGGDGGDTTFGSLLTGGGGTGGTNSNTGSGGSTSGSPDLGVDGQDGSNRTGGVSAHESSKVGPLSSTAQTNPFGFGGGGNGGLDTGDQSNGGGGGGGGLAYRFITSSFSDSETVTVGSGGSGSGSGSGFGGADGADGIVIVKSYS